MRLISAQLAPDGVAIIITPRPGSLWVAENFRFDTTYIRPYPFEIKRRQVSGYDVLAGGVEPDSNHILGVRGIRRVVLRIRRLLIGLELFDFAYSGGTSYTLARKSYAVPVGR